jgi:hypothetical protein
VHQANIVAKKNIAKVSLFMLPSFFQQGDARLFSHTRHFQIYAINFSRDRSLFQCLVTGQLKDIHFTAMGDTLYVIILALPAPGSVFSPMFLEHRLIINKNRRKYILRIILCNQVVAYICNLKVA